MIVVRRPEVWEGGRGGREERSVGGRECGRKGGRKGGREGEREGEREGGREGGGEGERQNVSIRA